MDDNATCHRTLAVQDCLDGEGIQRLVWPARSPDLNPIENVWDALGRQVAGRNYPPTNKNTLIRALTEEWDKLPQQLLDNVVQSMAEREFLLTPAYENLYHPFFWKKWGEKEREAWVTFKNIEYKFLRNIKSPDYKFIVQRMLAAYKALGGSCWMCQCLAFNSWVNTLAEVVDGWVTLVTLVTIWEQLVVYGSTSSRLKATETSIWASCQDVLET
ncbi:trimethylguanosine synthase [Trichonephila clavipes]|nr:trimethylguanosine synthase [Trichonephila clavipes]